MQQVLYKAGGREKVWGHAMHVKKFNISDVAAAVEDGWSVHPKDAIDISKSAGSGSTSAIGFVGQSQVSSAPESSLITADDLEQLRSDLAHSDGLVESLTADNDSLKIQLEEKNSIIDERNEQISGLMAELEQAQAQLSGAEGKGEGEPEEKPEDEAESATDSKKATRGRAK